MVAAASRRKEPDRLRRSCRLETADDSSAGIDKHWRANRKVFQLGLAGYQPLILYIGAIIACILSIAWKPQIALYYVVPLLPMQTARYWLHAYPLGEKLVDFSILSVLIGVFLHTERPIFAKSSLNKLLIFFFLFTYFSLWQGAFYLDAPLPYSISDPRFSEWKNFIEMMLFFFVAAATIRTQKQVAIVIGLMCLSVLMVNRSYHSTIGDRDFSQFSYALRDAGPLGFAGENGMAAFQAEFAVFLIVLAAFVKKWIWRAAIWGVACTCIYSLLYTLSRGGYLGFLVGLLVLGLIKDRKFLLILFALLLTWQAIVPNAVRERVFMTYSQGQGLDSSAQDRVSIWEDAMQVIQRDPAFGSGFNSYAYMGRVNDYKDTHNYYVKVLLELGAVGLLLFLSILVICWKMTWQLFRNSKDSFLSGLGCATFVMLCTAAIVNFFGDRWSYLQVNGFFWVLLGLVARSMILTQQDMAAGESQPESFACVTT